MEEINRVETEEDIEYAISYGSDGDRESESSSEEEDDNNDSLRDVCSPSTNKDFFWLFRWFLQ